MKKTTLATIVLLTLSLISVRADIVGFGENGAGWTLNGHDFFGTPSLPIISGNVLYITEVTNAYRARSVFFNTPQPIGNFTATFTYQNLTAVGTGGQPGNPGDGIVFAIQNQGASAVGGCCGQLGFDGITQASGVALHIYGASETGYAPATVPTNGTSQYTSTLSVDLRAAYPITVTVAYDGTTLSERLEDTITHASFSNSYTVDLQSAVNSDTALIGFTAGTGAATSDQRISDFSFSAAQTPLTIRVYPTNQFAIIAPTNFINLQAAASNSSAFQWCQESGANQVLFTDPTSSNTTVIFNYAGTYRLSVSASDGMHAASAFVDAIVEVNTNAVFQNISNFLAATIPDPTNNANIFLSFYKNGNGAADANAYYAALDALEPGNSKTNFARWKMANGFPSGPIPAATNGSVVSATYFNAQDLGLARRVIMQVTTNATTTNWAFAASHYKSLEDALADTNKEVTEAIDYSTSFPFPKFYVFSNDVSETRVPSDGLDGGGQKFVPSLCLVCHAGTSFQGGSNTHGHFLPFVLRALDYPCATGLSRGEQEPAFRAFNAAVFGVEKDIATRNSNEARPTLLNLIQGWYGVGFT